MVRKRDKAAPAPEAVVPKLPERVEPGLGAAVPKLDGGIRFALAGSPYRWGDYEAGEKIDHIDGMTLEEAEHQIATRLYQNTAKVHFNQLTEARAASASASSMAASSSRWRARCRSTGSTTRSISPGSTAEGSVDPVFAGDTVYAWSEVLEKAELPGRKDVGALRTGSCRQEQGLRGVPVQEGGRPVRRRRHARPRHLAPPAALTVVLRSVRHWASLRDEKRARPRGMGSSVA